MAHDGTQFVGEILASVGFAQEWHIRGNAVRS